MPRTTAVLFDVDGTLRDHPRAVEAALEALAPEVARLDGASSHGRRLWDAIHRYVDVLRGGRVVDRRYWMLMVDPLPAWEEAFPGAPAPLLAELALRFRTALRRTRLPYGEAEATLAALAPHYPLAVVSNGPTEMQERMITAWGLRGYFRFVAGVADDPKPAPGPFLRGCAALGVEPAEAVYVGDSIDNDVEGARAAGLLPVWVDRYRLGYELEGAHRIESLAALPGLLASLRRG